MGMWTLKYPNLHRELIRIARSQLLSSMRRPGDRTLEQIGVSNTKVSITRISGFDTKLT